MNDEHLNSEARAAEQFDALISSAQAGQTDSESDNGGITSFVEWAGSIHPDPIYAANLEQQLRARYPAKRRHFVRWTLAVAAMLAVVVAISVLIRQQNVTPAEESTPQTEVVVVQPTATISATMLPSATTTATSTVTPTSSPVAIAATTTLAVEINATLSVASNSTQQAGYQMTTIAIVSSVTPTPSANTTFSEWHVIQVTDPHGLPVLGANVSVYGENTVTQLVTTANGTAYFYPQVYGANDPDFHVVVSQGNAIASFELERGVGESFWSVTLEATPVQPPVPIDILFLLNFNGNAPTSEFAELTAWIAAQSVPLDARYALVAGTQIVDFTRDIEVFSSALGNISALSGSLDDRLAAAINGVNWREDPAIKIVIILTDHMEYGNNSYALVAGSAAREGITIHVIAPAESLASLGPLTQITGGQMVELESNEAAFGLGKAVINLVSEELAALSGS